MMAKKKESGLSALFTKEDWLAVWLGFIIIAVILIGANSGWKPHMPKFKWSTDGEFSASVAEKKSKVEKFAQEATDKGEAEVATAATALKTAMDSGKRSDIGKAAKGLEGASKNAKENGIKKKGEKFGKDISGEAGAVVDKVFSGDNILNAVYIGVAYLVLSLIGIALMGGNVGKYIIGFPVVFAFAWLSQLIAGNATVGYWGFEYVIFALIIGLVISNTVGVPSFMQGAVQTEYYIKTGLVILGGGILFLEILQGGALGIIQAVFVVSIVWYACFWIAKKLRVDDDFAAMLSTAVSICGVSAAIAACGAVEGDKKKLSYVASLVMLVAAPMMVIMPWLVKSLGIPDVVGGAWLGGTLDTSGSVVAAGALISEPAMKAGVVVKFSQNVLIGVAAFLLSIVWSLKKGKTTGERVSASVIWERFPKFVLGFMIASFVFSFILPDKLVADTKGIFGGLRTVWFALAFVSIGLETKFTEMVGMEGGRPAAAFIIAQALNVIVTLILAYIIFGGYIFPIPEFK